MSFGSSGAYPKYTAEVKVQDYCFNKNLKEIIITFLETITKTCCKLRTPHSVLK